MAQEAFGAVIGDERGNGLKHPPEAASGHSGEIVRNRLSIHDLARAARRRLPRVVWDYVEGGAEDEGCIRRNVEAFAGVRLVPRYLVDVARRDQTKTLFGKTYASPFGIAPTGMAELARPGADTMLAQAARAANIPYILSGSSNASVEEIARANPEAWLQLYPSRDPAISLDILRRGREAGLTTLVLTVDVPLHSKRERNIRSGWVRPYKPTLPVALEALTHPGWVRDYLHHGLPSLRTWAAYAPAGADARGVAAYYAETVPCPQSWTSLDVFRKAWPGTFVLKGVLHPDDAARACEAGIDGLIVSNHGGRQLDRSIATLAALPAVRDAVAGRVPVMLDSGIRRGSDIAAALCMGAAFTFVGRATLYGVAADGRAGADRAIRILQEEIDLVTGQIGCPAVRDLDGSFLAPAPLPSRHGAG